MMKYTGQLNLILLASIFGLFTLTGCAASAPKWVTVTETGMDPERSSAGASIEMLDDLNAQGESGEEEPELAPGFLLVLENGEDKNLNSESRIAFDGTLKLPYDVKIATAGLSMKQLKEKLSAAYKPFFKGNPRMQVRVKEKTHLIEVQGLVEKPGRYLMRKDNTLDDVISTAGNLQKGADQAALARYAKISARNAKEAAFVKLSDHFSGTQRSSQRWIGGSKVVFQKEGPGSGQAGLTRAENTVLVLGQVKTPGEYMFREKAGFLHYFVEAGGPTDRADLGNMVLVRDGSSGKRSMRFSIEQLESVPQVEGGDVILVHADNPSSTEKKSRVWGSVGGFLNTIATTVLAVAAL